MRTLLVIVVLFCRAEDGLAPAINSRENKAPEKHPGFFTFYRDAVHGKVYVEICRRDKEFLYVHSLPAGVGSNDIVLVRRANRRRADREIRTKRPEGVARPTELRIPRVQQRWMFILAGCIVQGEPGTLEGGITSQSRPGHCSARSVHQ